MKPSGKVSAIINAIIYPMDEAFTCFNPGTIVFDQSGILAIGPTEATVTPEGAMVTDAGGHMALMPGLIDAHTHSGLLKGFTENRQLIDWLPEYQREHQTLTEDDAYYSCLLTYMDSLKGGTTTVMDMYRFMHRGAQAAGDLGMRAHLVPYGADHPTKHFFETLETTEELIENHHNTQQGRVKVWIGLEHITYCSESMFRAARDMSDRYGVNIHTHTSEQKEEVELVKKLFGDRPVHKFNDWGILKPGTVLAHGVWLDDKELEVLVDTGTGVVHCPISNMKLAGGVAPLEKYKMLGITLGLGSDGGLCNNTVSMFECMKYSSLLQKVTHLDPCRITAQEAMKMATIDGARVLGIDHEVGSLEVGKQADMIAINLWQPHLMPIDSSEGHDPIPWNLVFAGRASDVQHVWVQGVQVISEGRCTQIDEDQSMQEIRSQTLNLLERRKSFKAIPMV